MISMVEGQIKMWQCGDVKMSIGARCLPLKTRSEIRPRDESKLIAEPNRRPEDEEEEILLNNLNTEKHES